MENVSFKELEVVPTYSNRRYMKIHTQDDSYRNDVEANAMRFDCFHTLEFFSGAEAQNLTIDQMKMILTRITKEI